MHQNCEKMSADFSCLFTFFPKNWKIHFLIYDIEMIFNNSAELDISSILSKILRTISLRHPVINERMTFWIFQMIHFQKIYFSASFQGILGLVHYLRTSAVDVKLSISRKLMRILFAKTDAPMQFARQLGWQECLAR